MMQECKPQACQHLKGAPNPPQGSMYGGLSMDARSRHYGITNVLYSEKIWWTLNFMILAKILFFFFNFFI